MSAVVTAITIEANVSGCSDRVGLATIHPAAGRNRADGGASEAERDAAAVPPTGNAKAQKTSARRKVICPCLRRDWRRRSEMRYFV